MTKQDSYELRQLIKRLAILLHQNIDASLRPYDLARTQYIVLYYLDIHPDISTSELAEKMQIEPATLSGIADTLQAKGLVERVDHATDRRRKDIRCTNKGRRLFATIPPPGPAIEKVLLDGIDPAAAATMKTVGLQMLENLEKELEG